MRRQPMGRSRAPLSPIMDESLEADPKPWAITQQHGKTMNKSQSRLENRVKQETLKLKLSEGKGKKGAENNKITLPVLGSLSMNIEAHNPYDNDKKSNHEALYKSRLLRTKKQKSIEGMFQAAKANKELSQILLNMNPSFNLDIEEHSLYRFLAPNRHLVPEDVGEEELAELAEQNIPTHDVIHRDDVTQRDDVTNRAVADVITADVTIRSDDKIVRSDALTDSADLDRTELYDVTALYASSLPPLPGSLHEDQEGAKPPGPPPPLTSHELVRRSKVIEAVAPSTLWVPASSVQCGEFVL